MPTCRICLRTFKSLRFQTEHIDICTRCVNTLNDSPEPAKNVEARFAEKLARGMQRNAERDLKSDKEWKRRKAQQTLENLDAAVAANLHDWITKLLADPCNSTRDFKIMRAYRRGLLRMEGFADYRDDWKEAAQRVRRRDGFKCMACGTTDTKLDVHHIIYLSHQGTNQQNNLITLCRACHEDEHDRVFDWPESKDPESISPVQPQYHGRILPSEQTQAEPIPEPSYIPASVSMDQLSGGFDHELMMDGATIAGAYIESGIRNFSQYATMMIENLGDGIKPYLLSFWEGIRSYPGVDIEGMTGLVESKHLYQELLTSQSVVSQTVRKMPEQSNANYQGADAKSEEIMPIKDQGVDNNPKLRGYIDPELLVLVTEIAAFHIEAGAHKFSDYAQMMVADLGDTVEPYLSSAYEGARHLLGLNAEVMSPASEQSNADRKLGQHYMCIDEPALFFGDDSAFDEEVYAKVKPLFAVAMRDAEAASKDLRDFFRTLVNQFGGGVKPYILRYAEDLKQGQDYECADVEESTLAQHQELYAMRDIRHLSENRISRELGEALSKRLVNACIRDLQRMDGEMLLSGDSSGLRNTWDEVCVQQQRERSYFWQTYLTTIETFIEARLEDLQPFELDALWLQTDEYDDWDCELEGERETYPVNRYHVLGYLQNEVLIQANNWNNERISRYLERRYDQD